MWRALLILLITYLVLNQVGVSDNEAAFWAPTTAALVAVLLVWRAARNGEAQAPELVRRPKLAGRVLALAVLTQASMSLVAGLVGGFVPVTPPGGSPDHAMAIGLRLATTVSLPLSLILISGVGRLSATWLTVRRPFRWLGMISVIPALVSFALHPTAVAFSRNYGSTPPRDLAEMAPRTIAVTILIFCALALGHLSGRQSLRRRAAGNSTGHGTSPRAFDTGEVMQPGRTTT
ncbi:hypothetical protein Q2K19_29005 [Micromonospora soli]|uniref:hypothetical protein n=1 Tax=Micromonospora sp. NBRC 110009 TaxID=3061627 RepID=UPI0026721206|nr:hypothetical protein [Micromonospora sp. NBRC 110009]WKT98163.1 hypothetical protein Q2K19_29005 [Micromonospora sp. NBRC 110009]